MLMEHMLFKFISKKQYLKDFLDGKLYMNSLYYFWNEYAIDAAQERRDKEIKENHCLDANNYTVPIEGGPGPGQIDLFEGTVKTVASKDNDLPQYLDDSLMMDMVFRSVGMGYCNVLSFFRLDYEIQYNGLTVEYYLGDMKEFGDYVVIIDDKDEFLRRVNSAANKHEYKYLCGSVKYKTPTLNGEQVRSGHNIVLKCEDKYEIESGYGDAFVKMEQYENQREWRIALYRGIKDTQAYSLEIGNIRDIVHWVKRENLHNEIESMFRKNQIKRSDSGWYGNVGRSELRKLFYKLGDNKAEKLIVIG